MSLPEREAIDPEYRIDLTRIYKTPEDWERARAQLETELAHLEASADDSLETAADLRSLLQLVEECYRRKQRLELYVKTAYHVRHDEAPDWEAYHDVESSLESSVRTVRRRLAETDDARLDRFGQELDTYHRYAENLRDQARHVRSREVEEVVSAFDGARRAPNDVISAVWDDYDPPTVERPDGETIAIRSGNRRRELDHPDRDYRRRVHDAFWSELERFEETLATAYVGKLRAAAAEASVRGYASIRERDFRGRCFPDSGLRSALPGDVHDTFLEAIRDNLGPYHRLLELRRERLGVDHLRPWDLDVSIAAPDPPDLGYETAKLHVLAALEPLGDEYVDRCRSLFDDRRIDVYPTEGKSGHEYTPSSATDGPFVVAFFNDDVDSLFALSHGLGHAMAVEYHRVEPTRYATCPRPVGEIPSMVHELLLADHFLERDGPLAEAAQDSVLRTLEATLYRDAMVSAFGHDLATRIERDETVDAARIRTTQRECLEEFRAPVAYREDAGRTWLGRGTRPIYDSYAYVLGASGALAVRDRLRSGDLKPESYKEFLRSTGRENSVALFERLGIDATAPEPYERAVAAFDGYVDEFETRR